MEFQLKQSLCVTIQMKTTEQYFPVVLFIMLYKVVLTFVSVDEILWCDHSNESFWAVLSRGTVYYAVQGGSNFWVCGWNPMMWPFKKSSLPVLLHGAICFLKFDKMKFGHLVEICLWLNLAVKGLKEYMWVQSGTSCLTCVGLERLCGVRLKEHVMMFW